MTNTTLNSADFTNANLSGVKLTNSNLSNVNLSNSIIQTNILYNANLTSANLTSSTFSNTNLSNSILTNSNLQGTNLSTANLSGVISGGITGNPSALPPGWELLNGYLVYLPPCFVEKTKILTPRGHVNIEKIKNGDSIITEDNRIVKVKIFETDFFVTNIKTAPILIPANSIKKNIPPNNIILSPNHAIKIGPDEWQYPKKLIKIYPEITKIFIGQKIKYYHIETPNYLTDNIIANNSVVE